ncbi:hypothetical protein LCGC14_0661630 [marine sediment metagenome]|uniref:Glycosyltransferase 2-like domain-containing protein n=1 Tax=marine sediment metagenome TaxID=412755 RepID=A0A0F9U1P3_9ZZZZ
MPHPLTDILCLCYNQLSITQQFVKHLFANTQNFRVSFLDNNSTDKTLEYLEKISQTHENCFYFHSDKNLGIIKGRNYLANKLFTSSYFNEEPSKYFLNIDNDQYVIKNTWLSQLHNLMSQGYDIVGVDAWQLLPPNSKRTVVISSRLTKDSSYFPHRRCTQKRDAFSYVGCGGCLIKKTVYDDIGLFDERYRMCYFEDPDYSFTAIKAGYKIAWLHNCPILHLSHQTLNSQISYDKHKEFSDSWKSFREKWYPYFPDLMVME